jgi:hypothetical protein
MNLPPHKVYSYTNDVGTSVRKRTAIHGPLVHVSISIFESLRKKSDVH